MTYFELIMWGGAFTFAWRRLGAGAAFTEGQIESGSSIIFLLMMVVWLLIWITERE